jgi:hypothetical protein
VRDVHERDAHLGLDALELELHLPPQLEVERAQRLVEQQHARAVDDRPRERDALLLPAGELRRLAPGEMAELDQVERLVHLPADVLDPASLEPERDVLVDVEVREQRVALEHRVHRPLVRLAVRDVEVAEVDRTLGRLLEPGDHAQRRRLAAAGGAEQREERPLRHHQPQVVDGDEVAETLADGVEAEVPHVVRTGHQTPSTFWKSCVNWVSSSASRVRKTFALTFAGGKMFGLSTSSGSSFSISSLAPFTGQM